MRRARVIVVGAGPAGLCTALFLVLRRPALAGRLLVLEKSRFPREKICAGAVAGRGERTLARYGVSIDVPHAPFSAMEVRFGAGALRGRVEGCGRVVRRVEFDAALADAARARGVEVREGVAVRAVRRRADAVELETSAGPLEADVVVGADGVGSVVRASLGLARGKLRAQVVEVDTEAAPGDPAPDEVRFDLSDARYPGYVWDFPTVVGGRRLVCRGVYRLRDPGERPDPTLDAGALLTAHLARLGLAADGVGATKRFAERGWEPHAPAAAPRVLLVGEAAGIDAVTGEGIAQAIEYGDLAARTLAERLGPASDPSRDAVGFEDWPTLVARSRLGLDLALRHALLAATYGPRRERVARLLVREPGFFPVLLAKFAGRPLPAARALRTFPTLLHAMRLGAA